MTFPVLISVDSAAHTAVDGVLDLVLTANLGDGPESIPYTYAPGDTSGLGPVLGTYMTQHPNLSIAAYVPPPAVLPNLLPYQFRAMLVLSGHQTALDTYVASLSDPAKTIAQMKLDYSLTFERHNSLVLAAQAALGLTDDQLDALWAQAAAIT